MHEQDRFDRFTERARKVLSLAQEEAQRFCHNYIGTEHLLLGLVREGDGIAAQVLSTLGVELNKVRSAVEFIIGRGDRIVLGEIGLTPRAKKVFELAVDEARRLNHHYIGTEHLLLGLIREGEGIAASVLASLGVNLEKVRSTTSQILATHERSTSFSSTPTSTTAMEQIHARVFIANRQQTTAAVAQRFDEQMAAAFGRDRVFSDTTPTPLGWDVREFIRQQISVCTVLVLIIGTGWPGDFGASDATVALDSNDPLIIEVTSALRHQKRIVPLFVQGATLPPVTMLPEAIRDIAYYQGAALRDEPNFDEDVSHVIAEIHFME